MMSAPLLLLLSFGLLATVSLLCFAGCSFQPGSASAAPYYTYEKGIVAIAGNVALWPLDEPSGTTAANVATTPPPGTDGTYLATSVPYPDDTGNILGSAPSPGTFPALNQTPGIVAGDCIGGNPNLLSPCTLFDGGYVNVPSNAAINPAQFTIEAWVRPDWTASDPAAYRAVMMSRNKDGGAARGFSLYAKPDNSWAVSVGDGSSLLEVEAAGAKLFFGMSNHLAATYDGSTLTIFVDGFPSSKLNVTYVPNTTQPLYIGAGAPELPLRTSPVVNDPTHGPLNPFKGVIQDAAIYNRALTATEVATNMTHGNACAVS